MFKSRTHAFHTFTKSDEDRMRAKLTDKNLCPYCEESGCPGTPKKSCNSDSKDFCEKEEWQFGFSEDHSPKEL